MTYNNIHRGVFLSRPNRFIAHVEIDGREELVHVKNTGRCRELLVPGAEVYVDKADNPNRSTKYDLVTVRKGGRLINMDSQAPNKVFLEHLREGKYIEGITLIKPEAKYGSSRFDFYAEAGGRKIFIEVKGVTLEENNAVLFPDAPTERGVRHIHELIRCVSEGYEAHAVFVVQMEGAAYFTPNNKTHPAFGEALRAAQAAGVKIAALDCCVSQNSLTIRQPVPIKL